MNRFLIFISFTFSIAVLSNCKSVGNISRGEAIERICTFWNPTHKTPILEKAWYQDSIGITQICGFFSEESGTSKTFAIRTIGYRFVDLRKMWAYEYGSFTDTATITRKFRCTDSAQYPGGWNFANRTPIAVDTFQLLSDTVIKAVTYKRCKISYIFNETRFDGIGLSCCDKKRTYFQIDTAMSNRMGCPFVYIRAYPKINPVSGMDTEVKFISDNFPDSVRTVFSAWKKNESLYPVK